MKKLLNVTLAISLVFQSFLGTGLVQATTTNESIVIEQVEESENLNEPVLEYVVEQEPIAKDEVVNESEVTEDIEIPPKEEHREVESESTDVSEENEEMNAESETVENEVVEDATLEENQLVADEVLLDDVEQEMEYGGDDYIIIQSDGASPRATAVVREAYRIKNTAYNFTSIKSNWWTLRGMPKLTAEAWGTIYTAFCVEPGIVHENGGNMDSSDINGYNSLTWPQREKINQIMMYGYGNNGDYSDDSYVATQAAIWEVVANHPSWGTIWGQLIQKHSNRDRIYNEIWSNIGTHGVIPSFMGRTVSKAPIISLKWNGSAYTATLTGTNGVLSKYQVISNNGDVQVSQNGNQLTLTTTNPNADVTLRLSKQGSTGGNTLYWVSGKQDVVTGGQDDPVHAYLKINVQSVGNVNLIKKSVTGEVIPNTQFRVVGNGVDTTVTTGANGEILVPNLIAGTYTVTEVSVPSPYILDTTPKTVEIKPNTTSSVEFINNVAKGCVEVLKTSETGGLVQGAIFEIRQNEKVIETITTGKDGIATSSKLSLGTYEVVETFVPSPLILDSTPKQVTLTYENMNTPVVVERVGFVNELAKAQIKVTKHGVNGEPVEGAKFEIKNADGKVVETVTTNAKGEVTTSKLPLGTYTATEIYVPTPYILDPTPQTITLEYADMVTPIIFGRVDFVNDVAKGRVRVLKLAQTITGFNQVENGIEFVLEDLPLADVTFNVYAREDIVKSDGSIEFKANDYVGTFTTNRGGITVMRDLTLGKYYITEVKAPNGIYIENVEYDFEFTYEDMNTPIVMSSLDVMNQRQLVKVNLTKVGEQRDGSYDLLDGVTFGLFVKEDIQLSEGVVLKADTLIQTQVTNELGELTFETLLPIGTFYVQELTVNEQYVLSDEQFEFTYDGSIQDQATLEIEINNGEVISNELVRGGFELTKKSETGEVLEGVEFTLFSQFKENLGTFVTDKNGKIEVDNLPYGKYMLLETKSANGHQLLQEPIFFSVRKDKEVIELSAVNQLTVTEILKVDENGNPLVGATLQVLDLDGKVVDEWVSTEKSHEILGLKHQKYILHEVSAPSGYRLMEDVEFEITDQAETLVIQAINEYTEVHIDKYDPSGNKLFGATMQIINKATGEVVEEWITTDETKVIEGLPHDDYILREITAPDGFQKVLDIEFTITDENKIHVFEVTDELTRVEIDKYEPNGNKLFGAIMQIINKATGEVVEEWRTTDETKIIEGLAHGDYILREITAPDGFQKILDIEFTITDENKIHVFEITDELTLTTIHKVDSNGNQLKGATLQVYKIENGEEIFITEFVTGKDSTDLKGLKPGQYVLREVKAPKGYLKAEDVYFTVTDAHEVVHVTMVDEFDRTVPTTGFSDVLPMIAGVGLVSVGTLIYLKQKRQK